MNTNIQELLGDASLAVAVAGAHADGPSLLFDTRGCREANAAALHLFGFQNEDFLRHCLLSDLAPPLQPDGSDSVEQIDALIESAGKSEAASTFLLRRADGNTFWAEVGVARESIEGEVLARVRVRDNSAEHGLEDSIDLLRQQLEIAHRRLQQAALKVDFVAANDPVSGLLNLRHLRKLAQVEADRSRRYGQSVSLVGAVIEDSHVMQAAVGDAGFDSFWIELAALINRNVRTADAVARTSSDAFVVLTPATGLAGAELVAAKMEGAIGAHSFLHGSAPSVRFFCAEYQYEEEPVVWLQRAMPTRSHARTAGNGAGHQDRDA